ncbi:MAG: hypothetical protein ACYC23_21745 [Limisphaerales bacterium]
MGFSQPLYDLGKKLHWSEAMLALAPASAHVGLAALLKGDADRQARRFILAQTLRNLADFQAKAEPARS